MMLNTKIVGCLILMIFLSVNAFCQTGENPQVKTLISELYQNPWSGAAIVGESPTMWDFSLTAPMKKILDYGQPAQTDLLQEINNPQLTDQIIFLLGGVGDEKAIGPIIKAMIPKSEFSKESQAKKLNQSANVALTNITAAEVIWPQAGGVIFDKCPKDPKGCWQKWWDENKKSFTAKTDRPRPKYSIYPGYGIYGSKN